MKISANKNNIIYTGRGTAALWAILKALNLSDKGVLIPVNVCEVVAAAILKANMKPVYYDVDPIEGNGDLEDIQAAFQNNVKVLVLVHNYGTPMDIETIMPWAREKKLFVIEDVCNSLGGTYKGSPLGSFGDAAFYSFGKAKIIEIGVGGALTVRNEELREKARKILFDLPFLTEKHTEADRRFQSQLQFIRRNSELLKPSVYRPLYSEYVNHLLFNIDDSVVQKIKLGLKELECNINKRNEKARIYRERLKSPSIQHRKEVPGEVYWRYTFLVPENRREEIIKELRTHSLPVSAWFPPIHILFENGRKIDEFEGAHSFAKRVVNLWVNDEVSFSDITKTIDVILNILG